MDPIIIIVIVVVYVKEKKKYNIRLLAHQETFGFSPKFPTRCKAN